MHADDYNPAQQQFVDLLGSSRGTRPEFDRGLRDELRAELEDRLEPLAEIIDSDSYSGSNLYLSKFTLSQVLGCERKFMAEQRRPFEWSPPTARGTVAHKAIELLVHWRGEPRALDLVDDAINSLTERDASLADYLQTCGDVELAEVRAEANRSVSQFLECFPSLKPAWKPVTESRMRAELCGGRVVLSGKTDLTLGQPAGAKAGKVIIDLKTGGFSPAHREDLRFYALIESLRLVPPRRLATYYLDQGQPHAEDVTVDLLRSALERVVDGAFRYAELVTGRRQPGVVPGPACRWCPVQPDCEEGTAYLAGESEGSFEGW